MSNVLSSEYELKLSILTFLKAKISTKLEQQDISHHRKIHFYIIDSISENELSMLYNIFSITKERNIYNLVFPKWKI